MKPWAARIPRAGRSHARTEGSMAPKRQLRRARLAALLGVQAAVAARGAEGLSITGLRAARLRELVSKRSYTVVLVETRSGMTGFGECGAVADSELERAREVVLGQPATAYEVVRHALAGRGAIEAAMTMALLDVVGRHAKAPDHHSHPLAATDGRRTPPRTACRNVLQRYLLPRQERSSQTGNHGKPGRTRKGEVDSDALFRGFRWIPWLISDPREP